MTTYHYDSSNRLTEIDEPNGTTVTFAYDANGQRVKKTTQTSGSNPTMTVVNDTYSRTTEIAKPSMPSSSSGRATEISRGSLATRWS